MDTLTNTLISLLPGVVLGLIVAGLAHRFHTARPAPTAPTPPEPATPSRLQNEAALLCLSPEQRCAALLTSLDDDIAYQVYRLLDTEHQELLSLEIAEPPALHPGARQQMFDNVAELLGVPGERLQPTLAAKPQLAAGLLRSALPLTYEQAVHLVETPHDLPPQWGARRGDPGRFRPKFFSLFDWLQNGAVDDDVLD